MYLKNIPKTSLENYISGYEALNTPDKNRNVADWHPQLYWFSSKENEKLKLYTQNEILKDLGIEKRTITYPIKKEVYIANFPRAIVDLILTLNNYRVKGLYNAKEDFLNKEETEVLYKYLYKLKDIERIGQYLKYEFAKRYMEDLKNEEMAKR